MFSFLLFLPLFVVQPQAQYPSESISISEEVSVVADRFTLQERKTEKVQTLKKEDLENSAAVTVDDSLRKLSGFQLFRRSGSRTANPTSQGASLRGIGSSGGSRALVLYDGVPINDPFGGWIYWGAVPKSSLSAIEVYRGGGSDLYGTNALAGIINLIRNQDRKTNIELEGLAGNQGTSLFNLNTNANFFDTSLRFAAENFRSDGYMLLRPEDQGPVDHPAGSKHTFLEFSAERNLNSDADYFLRASYYDEDRDNGTELQTNATILRQISSGIRWNHTEFGKFRASVFGRTQQFDQQFTIVSPTRDSEDLASSQQVHANQFGFTSDWLSAPMGVQTFQAGVDVQRIHGDMKEWLSDPIETIGGKQLLFGSFVHDRVAINERFDLTVGARFDSWRNTESVTSTSRTENAWSPRISLRYTFRNSTELNFAWYRAFRAPNLNELYRPFRLGNTLTLANANLNAEKLTGVEGTIVQSIFDRFTLRSTLFLMDVDGAIANRTLLFSPAQIIRQRENLGKIQSKGIEFEVLSEFDSQTRASIRYQYADSKIEESIVSTLEGLRTPQVPYHQASFNLQRDWSRRFSSNIEARYASSQFEDDLNRFLLSDYFTLDLTLRYNILQSLEIFAAAENLLNQQYELGRIPFPTYGPPRFIQVGIRFKK